MTEPNDADPTRLLSDAAERGVRYLEQLPDRRVSPTPQALSRLAGFDEALPDGPCDPIETLRMLDEVGTPAAMASSSPRFFGFVVGGTLPVTIAANWLATAWDQNTGAHLLAPPTSALEDVAIPWLLDVLSLPPESGVGFVTGTMMAHVTTLTAARRAVLLRAGWDPDADGLFGAPPVTVVIGGEAHPTIARALGLLGMGRKRVVEVPVDGQGRMRADALPRIEGPTIVCVQAGNVNTGAFDPIREIVEHAHEGGAWVHVDGAFGLWASAAPGRAHLVDGVEEADSWATDAHKWLNTPYDCGLAIVREGERMREALSVTAAYLPYADRREPDDYTPEFSRRGRGVEVWAALRTLGRSGVADLVERCCRHAQRFADGLREAGYEILNDVVLNQVLVSFGDEEKTRRVIAAIQDDGTCWCGGTVWQGRTAMRISVSSWMTTEEDVKRSLQAMLRAAASA